MRALGLALLLATLAGCIPRQDLPGGTASWYGSDFRGRPTASGEPFRPRRKTAAHRSLPFGTVLRVCAPSTGRCVRVVVNDRGPYVDGRVIDLSRRAARRLRIREVGVAEVTLQRIGCSRAYDGPRSCRARR